MLLSTLVAESLTVIDVQTSKTSLPLKKCRPKNIALVYCHIKQEKLKALVTHRKIF
jgi:hypothetical protein